MSKLVLFATLSLFSFIPSNSSEEEITDIVNSTLTYISGPAGGEYDWNGFQSLFMEDATLVGFAYARTSNEPHLFRFSITSFIEELSSSYEENDFYEYATSNEVLLHGSIAHVWQSYEAYDGEENLLESGVNSYQLIKIDGKWKIAHLIWDSKRD